MNYEYCCELVLPSSWASKFKRKAPKCQSQKSSTLFGGAPRTVRDCHAVCTVAALIMVAFKTYQVIMAWRGIRVIFVQTATTRRSVSAIACNFVSAACTVDHQRKKAAAIFFKEGSSNLLSRILPESL